MVIIHYEHLFWCSIILNLTRSNPSRLVSVFFWHIPIILWALPYSLAPNIPGFYFPCPSPGIRWLVYRNQVMGARCAHCYWVSPLRTSKPSTHTWFQNTILQWREPRFHKEKLIPGSMHRQEQGHSHTTTLWWFCTMNTNPIVISNASHLILIPVTTYSICLIGTAKMMGKS